MSGFLASQTVWLSVIYVISFYLMSRSLNVLTARLLVYLCLMVLLPSIQSFRWFDHHIVSALSHLMILFVQVVWLSNKVLLTVPGILLT